MAQAAELRVCVERDWGRDRRGHLRGAYGRMIRREIESRFNSGPPSARYGEDETTAIPTGGYDRWDQLEALSDLGFDPLAQVVDGQHIIYDQPIQVRGDLAASPVWSWLRQTAGLDRALSLHHRTELALGSAVIRPVFKPWRAGIYHPAGLRVTPPDQCIAIADPTSPGRLITYAECIPASPDVREHWLVWDVSDPGAPYLGRWESVDAWVSGRSPTWLMEGAVYPFWMNGRPLIGAVAGQAIPETDEPAPFFRGRAQGLKDLVMQRLWVDYVRHVSSINRALILSELKVHGLGALTLDPNVVGNVWGSSGVQPVLETIEHGLDGVKILGDMLKDRVEEWAQGVDPRFEVRRASEVAKSGTALMIEHTGQVQAANKAETRREPIDVAVIEMLSAAHNYLVRSGQIRLMQTRGGIDWAPYRGTSGPEWLIPEVDDIAIGYTRRWNEVERQRKRAELFAAAEVGLDDWRAVWLFDRGLEDDRPDGENWTAAGEAIEGALGFKARAAALGLGVAAEKLWLRSTVTPEDETELHAPPHEVASSASRGLGLRAEHRRGLPAGPGAPARGRHLLGRSKRLQRQDAMDLGEVRSLNTWLLAHENDGDKDQGEGIWGDDSDPSAMWVEWLSQGGKDGLAWTNGILTEPAEVDEAAEPEPEPESGAIDDAL